MGSVPCNRGKFLLPRCALRQSQRRFLFFSPLCARLAKSYRRRAHFFAACGAVRRRGSVGLVRTCACRRHGPIEQAHAGRRKQRSLTPQAGQGQKIEAYCLFVFFLFFFSFSSKKRPCTRWAARIAAGETNRAGCRRRGSWPSATSGPSHPPCTRPSPAE